MLIHERDMLSKKYGPINFPTITPFVNSVILVWLGWYSYNSYHQSKITKEHDFRIECLRGAIIHLDEVMIMSARMAVVTGDLQWEERYRRSEPQLDDAIKETMRLAPEAYSTAASTDVANIRLVEMENSEPVLAGLGKEPSYA